MYRKKIIKTLNFLPSSSGLTIFAMIDRDVMKIVPPIMSTNGPEIKIPFTLSTFFYTTLPLWHYTSKCYLVI